MTRAGWAGPQDARMVVVGEAWGEEEDQCRAPFVGPSGKELWRMLGEALPDVAPTLHNTATHLHYHGNAWVRARLKWMEHAGVAFTNVFNLRPAYNRLGGLCHRVPNEGLPALGRSSPEFPNGGHLRPEHLPHLQRLRMEILASKPNVVVAAGGTAAWALLHTTAIGSIRGTAAMDALGMGVKVLPTYHPANVLRQWSNRPVVVADLMKAWREAKTPDLVRPSRHVLINPTFSQLSTWVAIQLIYPPPLLAVDIETAGGQITCIGFSPTRDQACVVPFIGPSNGSYWPNGVEIDVWKLVKQLLESPIPKLFQNGLYDLQYITRMGIRPANCTEDTMLLHHSLFPELRKGLGFLGSIYTNEASWKLMNRPKADTVKRDE